MYDNQIAKHDESPAARAVDVDIWNDDEGCWYQRGPQTYGPFPYEAAALQHALMSETEAPIIAK